MLLCAVLCCAVKGSLPCLHSMSFSLPAGALVAVTGPVGAGKSSLLAAILGEQSNTRLRIAQQGLGRWWWRRW